MSLKTIKTKKYQLQKNKYITMSMKEALMDWWWVWFIPLGIMLIPAIYPPAFWWCFGISLTAIILYLLFWFIQFTGVTQMEQSKILFERLSYEIDSRQVLIKISSKQGMPLTWDKIQKVKKAKDHFLFIISKGQFIYLPFNIFKTESDIKFLETILKRKNFIQ